MDRRRFLTALAAGGAAGLAGCLFVSGTSDRGELVTPVETTDGGTAQGATDTRSQSARTNAAATDTGPLGSLGFPPDICEEEVKEDPGIYAITEPAFDSDWEGRSISSEYRLRDQPGLAAEQTVVGLEWADGARAYPITLLWQHEIVNDDPGAGETALGPVIVTYCPLCRSGMVASRVVGGSPTLFAVTGLLWKAPGLQEAVAEDEDRVFGAERTGGEEVPARRNGNLVMIDGATGSYWSQILARGICGPEESASLRIVPSTVATWAEWRDEHPDTQVLLPPPYSETTNPDGA